MMWVMSFLASLVAIILGILVLSGANGAPQKAAGAVIALMVAIVPYTLARSWDKINKK